jgi:hypothetical protein
MMGGVGQLAQHDLNGFDDLHTVDEELRHALVLCNDRDDVVPSRAPGIVEAADHGRPSRIDADLFDRLFHGGVGCRLTGFAGAARQ